MRKILAIVLAVVMVASLTVIAAGAVDTGAAATSDGTATVTLTSVKGDTVTKTYAVGETFTATTYLNTSGVSTDGVACLKGEQIYTDSVLEVADAYEKEDEYEKGVITDIKAMFPVCGGGAVANAGISGTIHYNASIASMKGYKYDTDDKVLMVVNYKVKAAGTATIKNEMTTLALSDFALTRIIDKGEIKQTNFKSAVELSEPASPVTTGYTVKGTIKSFLTDDDVTVKLTGNNNDYVGEVTGKTDYSIVDVPAGEYTMTVSKKNHATREYTITVSGADVTQNAEINPIGDVNGDGKVTIADYSQINKHVCKVKYISDYKFVCADLNNDGSVSIADLSRVNKHVCKVKYLFPVA